MSGKSFMRSVAGIFGGLIISMGIMIIFVSLIVGNMTENVDKLDDITKASMKDFASNNKEDIREFALQQLEQNPVMKEQMDKQLKEFTKENLAVPCSQPEVITDPNVKKLLIDDGVCDMVNDDTKTNEDIKNTLIDRMIAENLENVEEEQDDLSEENPDTQSGSEEIKKAITELEENFGSPSVMITSGIIMILIGCFLTFVSVKFKIIRALYRICLKLTVNLVTVGILFTIFKYIKPETLVKLMKNAGGVLKDANLQGVPESVMIHMAKSLLDWLRLSTNPLVWIAFVSAVPFIIATFILFFLRVKDKAELTGKEEKSIPE